MNSRATQVKDQPKWCGRRRAEHRVASWIGIGGVELTVSGDHGCQTSPIVRWNWAVAAFAAKIGPQTYSTPSSRGFVLWITSGAR